MSADRFVLDASVAIDWFLPGGGPPGQYAERVLERMEREHLLPSVPDLWHHELGSVLIAAKRDRRISATKLRASQLAIRGLKLETLAIELDAVEIIDLGQRYHLQGYDVVYFELARRLAIPIASIDGGIKTACSVFGVELLRANVS